MSYDISGQVKYDSGSRITNYTAHQARIDKLACSEIKIDTSSQNQIIGQTNVDLTTADSTLASVKTRTDPVLTCNFAAGTYDYDVWTITKQNLELIGDTRACANAQYFIARPALPQITTETIATIMKTATNQLTVISSNTPASDPNFELMQVVIGDQIVYWDDDYVDDTNAGSAGVIATVINVETNSLYFADGTFTGVTFTKAGTGFVIIPNVHLVGQIVAALSTDYNVVGQAVIKTTGVDFQYDLTEAYGPIYVSGSTFSAKRCLFRPTALSTAALIQAINSTVRLHECLATSYTAFNQALYNAIGCQNYILNSSFIGNCNHNNYPNQYALNIKGGFLENPASTWINCTKCDRAFMGDACIAGIDGMFYTSSCFDGICCEDGSQLNIFNMTTNRVYRNMVVSADSSKISFHNTLVTSLADDGDFRVPPSVISLAQVSYSGEVDFNTAVCGSYTAPTGTSSLIEFNIGWFATPTEHVLPNVPSAVYTGSIVRTLNYDHSSSVPYCYEAISGHTTLSGTQATPTTSACAYISTAACFADSLYTYNCTNSGSYHEIIPASSADIITFRGPNADTSVLNWRILTDH